MRRRWWWLVAIVAAGAVSIGLVVGIRGGGKPTHQVSTKPVLVGRIDLDPTQPRPGQPVIATITIRADRAVRLGDIVLSVRDARGKSADAAGRAYDFSDTGPIQLGAKSRTLTVAHEFPARGTYSYFLRYRIGKSWKTLPPYNTFTVG